MFFSVAKSIWNRYLQFKFVECRYKLKQRIFLLFKSGSYFVIYNTQYNQNWNPVV